MRAPIALSLVLAWAHADARVLPHAPLTERIAVPAVQLRAGRHVVLQELDPAEWRGSCPPSGGRLVVYDALGLEEPRVVAPRESWGPITVAAALDEGGALRLLVAEGRNVHLSTDGGASWRALPLPSRELVPPRSDTLRADTRGPVVGAALSRARLGPPESPFLVCYPSDEQGPSEIYSVLADGSVRLLARQAWAPPDAPSDRRPSPLQLAGGNPDRTRVLLHGSPEGAAPGVLRGYYSLDLGGRLALLASTAPGGDLEYPYDLDGFLTRDGRAYLQPTRITGGTRVLFVGGSEVTTLVEARAGHTFVVPAADGNGAWLASGTSGSAALLRHSAADGLVTEWADPSLPPIEAVHESPAGALLLQLEDRSVYAGTGFVRHVFAARAAGSAKPRMVGELTREFETVGHGFVHLDVESALAGAPFLFDTGIRCYTGGAMNPFLPQLDWNVVRGSFRQRLVIPGVARGEGLAGSAYRSDLLVRNQSGASTEVRVRFQRFGEPGGPEAMVSLAAGETRHIPDVLGDLFGIQKGAGALFLTPSAGAVAAVSTTSTSSARGTYSAAVAATDAMASTGAALPISFSGGLPGPGFRANLAIVDTAGAGVSARVRAGDAASAIEVPRGAAVQVHGLGGVFGSEREGALELETATGQAIATMFVVDEATHDPTHVPPDLTATGMVAYYQRAIPAVVHADGANGAVYRTDLHLFNPDREARTIWLLAAPWTGGDSRSALIDLAPRESRTLHDVLAGVFGLTGVAQLFFSSVDLERPTMPGVRIASRTRVVRGDGTSCGVVIPPVMPSQVAAQGQTVEIVGARAEADSRINLAIVHFRPFRDVPHPVTVEILDGRGATIDAFEVLVPAGGGTQVNDVLRARGLAPGGPVVLRVTPRAGVVTAHATVIDAGTGDSVYLAGERVPRYTESSRSKNDR